MNFNIRCSKTRHSGDITMARQWRLKRRRARKELMNGEIRTTNVTPFKLLSKPRKGGVDYGCKISPTTARICLFNAQQRGQRVRLFVDGDCLHIIKFYDQNDVVYTQVILTFYSWMDLVKIYLRFFVTAAFSNSFRLHQSLKI